MVLGFDDVLGSLTVGKVADIVIWDAREHDGYRAILDAGVDDVALVLRGGPPPTLDGQVAFKRGRPLYGDAVLVDALQDRAAKFTSPPACDAIDVCGVSKKVCVAEQLGAALGLTALRASVDASYTYDLFFCNDPPNEPSCVPARPNEFTGAVTQFDRDGDNLAEADDNCPRYFNAPRPMDKLKQPDTDADGLGDICDPCPFDKDSTACTSIDPDDIDGDGFLNALDKCPSIPDDQTDTDSDGIGDACDACKTESNLGGKPCSSTIYKVQDGTVALGTAVALPGVVCVSAGPDFYTVQVKDAPTPEYSGLYVFVGASGAKCTPGTLVDLQGTVDDFFGQTQLADSSFVVTPGSGPVPIPAAAVVLPKDIAKGGTKVQQYEAVYVEVKNVAVTNIAPVAETNGTASENVVGEFVVTDDLRVDDAMYAITPAPTVGQTFPSLKGVLRYSWNKNKLMPRNAEDVSSGPPDVAAVLPAGGGTMYLGQSGGPLIVKLTGPAQGDTTVDLDSSDEAIATVPATVVVKDGESQAAIAATTVATGTVTVSASIDGGDAKTTTLTVVPANSIPKIAKVEGPDTVLVGEDFDLIVTLDLPARTGGETLDVTTSGVATTVLATATVAEGTYAVTVTGTAGAAPGEATVSFKLGAADAVAHTFDVIDQPNVGLLIAEVVYDVSGEDTGKEWVKLYNGTGAAVNLSGWALSWAGTDWGTNKVALTGNIPAGACFLIGGPTTGTGTVPTSYGQAFDFNPDLQNSGNASDAIGLFNLPLASVGSDSVPNDYVVYGPTAFKGLPASIGDAPANSSLRRKTKTTWETAASPTPNECAVILE